MKERTVFIVSRGYHNWDEAEMFGRLRFMSEGTVNRTQVSDMMRKFVPIIERSEKDDLIVITGLSIMCSIACSLFARKHGRLNLLIYDSLKCSYTIRNVEFPDEKEQEIEDNGFDSGSRDLASDRSV